MLKQIAFFAGCLYVLGCPAFSERVVEIDLTNQQVFLVDQGRVLLHAPICSGRPGHLTPVGVFHVSDKDINHASSVYGFMGNPVTKQIVVPDADIYMKVPPGLEFVRAPMRYFVQFAPGIGMHAGILPGSPQSHGCVRLPEQSAIAFFQAVPIGTPVHVFGKPDPFRAYWASPRTAPLPLPRLARFGWRGRNDADDSAERNREIAFRQFDVEWETKENTLERQLEVLKRRRDQAQGYRREQLQAQVRQIEDLKDAMENRRGVAKEALREQWND